MFLRNNTKYKLIQQHICMILQLIQTQVNSNFIVLLTPAASPSLGVKRSNVEKHIDSLLIGILQHIQQQFTHIEVFSVAEFKILQQINQIKDLCTCI